MVFDPAVEDKARHRRSVPAPAMATRASKRGDQAFETNRRIVGGQGALFCSLPTGAVVKV